MQPELIYCASGGRRFADIAVSAGYRYGGRLPGTIHYPLYFADQDWKRPDRAAYMRALARHRPTMATVLDWERDEQLPEVLSWAEEASQYVERVLIVPKVASFEHLPRRINGHDIALGYSVPTRYGGSSLLLGQLAGWPVHLLGGSPQRQMELWCYLSCIADVVSVDGNLAQRAATHCVYWERFVGRHGRWKSLGGTVEIDAPYEAFRRSCMNIREEWRGLEAARAA